LNSINIPYRTDFALDTNRTLSSNMIQRLAILFLRSPTLVCIGSPSNAVLLDMEFGPVYRFSAFFSLALVWFSVFPLVDDDNESHQCSGCLLVGLLQET
jgi:hypothetical protein